MSSLLPNPQQVIATVIHILDHEVIEELPVDMQVRIEPGTRYFEGFGYFSENLAKA